MIVVMQPGATSAQISHVTDRIEQSGLQSRVVVGTERTVVLAVGDERHVGLQEALESIAGIEKVLPVLAPYKIASKDFQSAKTVVRAGSLEVGGDKIAVIAGPCSVEGEEQILDIARQVKAAGASGLRGGAFKPRTSPYSFQGLKEEGLKLLALAREVTGLAIVTEVMTPHNVELVCRYADVLQIGARNMQNYDLLAEAGRTQKPVLLKRGPSATADEFLLAAEYVLDQGNRQVMLCERGIRTFETYTRFTLPLAIVPFLRQRTHLPIVVDPSHGTGIASLVLPMSLAAIAAGADALAIEVHTDPEKAWSDGAQTLSTSAFAGLMEAGRPVARAVGRSL